MKNQAFTLIELLVVVLIIGILAAVALPQYQTAVNKSRYAGLMPLARSVKDAEEAVFMTKNDYTADLEDLGIQVPGTVTGNTANTGKVNLTVVAGAGEGQDYVKAVDSRNTDNTFVMYFAKSPKYPGEIHCEALTANTKAQQLCKSYGPVGTVTGTDNTYTTYVLQGTGADAGGGGEIGGVSSGPSAWDWSIDDIVRLEDPEGFGLNGYDENDNLIFSCDYARDDLGDIIGGSCEGGFYYMYNESNNLTGERSCRSLNSDNTCAEFAQWGYDYYDYYFTPFSATYTYFSDDYYEQSDDFSGSHIEAVCSSVNSDGSCNGYSSLKQVSNDGIISRPCIEPNGSSCSSWGD